MSRLLAIVLVSFFSYGTVKAQYVEGFFGAISELVSKPLYQPTSEFTIKEMMITPPFLVEWDPNFSFDDIEKTIRLGLEDKDVMVSKASSNSLLVTMESKIGERSGDKMPKFYGYPTEVFYIYGEEEFTAEIGIQTTFDKKVVEDMKKMDVGRYQYVTKSQLQQLLKKIEKDCVAAGYKLREYDEKLGIYIYEHYWRRIIVLVGRSGDVSLQFYYPLDEDDDEEDEDED